MWAKVGFNNEMLASISPNERVAVNVLGTARDASSIALVPCTRVTIFGLDFCRSVMAARM